LQASAKFAGIFADDDLASEWSEAANAVRAAALAHLYQPDWGRFARTLRVDAQGELHADPVLDSSLVGLFQFGMLSPSDPRVVRTMQAVEERLWCKTPSGGMARYVDDYYHQISRDIQSVPGNPWFICTLWLADWYIARGVSPSFLGRALELLEWAVEHALPSGVLAEQVHPYTHQPLSVSPLTWSHATFVSTVLGFVSRERQMAQSGWDSYLRG
jgi:GH15 family glucan-1,4-alpha-glucosidase